MILSGNLFFSKKLSYKLLLSVRLQRLVYLNDGFINVVVEPWVLYLCVMPSIYKELSNTSVTLRFDIIVSV